MYLPHVLHLIRKFEREIRTSINIDVLFIVPVDNDELA